MPKSIVDIVAENVAALRKAAGEAEGLPEIGFYEAARRANKAAGSDVIVPNTIKNIEQPAPRSSDGQPAAARLDNVAIVAGAFGIPAWHLLVDGLDPAHPLPAVPPTKDQLEALGVVGPQMHRVAEIAAKLDDQARAVLLKSLLQQAEMALQLRSTASPRGGAGSAVTFSDSSDSSSEAA